MDLRFSEVRLAREMTGLRQLVQNSVRRLAIYALIILAAVLLINLLHLQSLRNGPALAQTSYELLLVLYKPLLVARYLVLVIGVGYLFIPFYFIQRTGKKVQELFTPVYFACLLVIIGEVLGRFLFYASHIRIGL